MKPINWFKYYDKNNNIYSLDAGILSYKAVRKKDSSSGEYSGGKDLKIKLHQDEHLALSNLLIQSKTSATQSRTKGCSLLKIEAGEYLFSYNSTSQKLIEQTLEKLINTKQNQSTHKDHTPKKHSLNIHLLLDGVQDKQNIAAAFRISEAFGVKKLILLDSGYDEVDNQIVKMSRHTSKHIDYQYSNEGDNILSSYDPNTWLILGLEITDRSIDSGDLELFSFKNILLIAGNEKAGIKQSLLDTTNFCVHIPMFGINSSMNVIQATGICIFNIIQSAK